MQFKRKKKKAWIRSLNSSPALPHTSSVSCCKSLLPSGWHSHLSREIIGLNNVLTVYDCQIYLNPNMEHEANGVLEF